MAALLLALTLLAYAPALSGEWLLDDEHHVTRPELRPLAGLARIWTDVGATQQYYPVLHTAFWLEHRLWGDATPGYHVFNVLLHVAAAIWLVPITRRLGLPGGWGAAFVFALHPVCVESVAWMAEQKNTLSLGFALAGILAYLAFDDGRAPRHYALASMLFVLALLSKTAMATLPVMVLVLVWWRRGNIRWSRDVAPLVPWLLVAGVVAAVTIHVERGLITTIQADIALMPGERWLVAGRAFWFYAANCVWPANLTFLYERWPVEQAAFWWHVFPIGAVVILLLSLRVARAHRGPLAVVLIYGCALLPVLGLVDVEWFVFSYVADHFAYHAMPVLIVALIAGAVSLAAKTGWYVPLAGNMAVWVAAIALALAAITWRHSGTFHDSVVLYQTAVARSPGSAVAHNHLGVALAAVPEHLPAAVAEFHAALALNPRAAETHENLGAALLATPGHADEAIAHLETALRLKPALTRVRPRLASAHFDSAKAAAAQVNGAAMAAVHYRAALRYNPDFPEAHYNLANFLASDAATLADAIEHYEAAVRLRPGFVEARTNLGVALTQCGRLDDAIAQFEAALAVNADYAPARKNLAHARALRLAPPTAR